MDGGGLPGGGGGRRGLGLGLGGGGAAAVAAAAAGTTLETCTTPKATAPPILQRRTTMLASRPPEALACGVLCLRGPAIHTHILGARHAPGHLLPPRHGRAAAEPPHGTHLTTTTTTTTLLSPGFFFSSFFAPAPSVAAPTYLPNAGRVSGVVSGKPWDHH